MQFFFFFQNATNPSFFFMLVYVLKKKRTYDIRDSYYKPVAPALCWCNLRTITPSGSRTQVSGAGCERSNKERQRLQPLASIGLNTTFYFLWFSLSSLRFLPPGVGLKSVIRV